MQCAMQREKTSTRGQEEAETAKFFCKSDDDGKRKRQQRGGREDGHDGKILVVVFSFFEATFIAHFLSKIKNLILSKIKNLIQP